MEYKGYIIEQDIEDPQSRTPPKSQKQTEQLKSYLQTQTTKTVETQQPLPQDIQRLFDVLNSKGLEHPHDPLCVDLNYTKGKNRFSVLPTETRHPKPPQQIQSAYQDWFVNEWKQKSMLRKILEILWYLPAHLYRKYLSSVDYRWYYNGLCSFLDRTRQKWEKKNH